MSSDCAEASLLHTVRSEGYNTFSVVKKLKASHDAEVFIDTVYYEHQER